MTNESATAFAISMSRYGAPDVLTWTERPVPELQPNEIRIRTIASAVNHTDLEIRAGNWPVRAAEPFPYVPGVETVGVVEAAGSDVRELRRGDRVITMMQGLGGVKARRPGGYATHVTVPEDAAAKFSSALDPFDIAAIGLGGVTAYLGLRRIGALAGKRIVVTGAAGGVGSAATAIARAQGAIVTGVVSRAAQADYVRSLGAAEVIVAADVRCLPPLPGEGVDGVLDTVGGALFGTCVAALRRGGTLSLVGAVGGSDVRFDADDLLRPVTLTGYSTEELEGPALREAMAALIGWLVEGRLKPPVYRKMPLADAARAHSLLEGRGVSGRLLLVPDDPEAR
jgi:NADPH2:quinone reductase